MKLVIIGVGLITTQTVSFLEPEGWRDMVMIQTRLKSIFLQSFAFVVACILFGPFLFCCFVTERALDGLRDTDRHQPFRTFGAWCDVLCLGWLLGVLVGTLILVLTLFLTRDLLAPEFILLHLNIFFIPVLVSANLGAFAAFCLSRR